MSSKRVVLLVDHGSRSAEANRVVQRLAELVRDMAAAPVEVAHLQFAEPTIAQGLDACVDAGAREIVVVPVFLAPGKHSITDIPRQVAEAAGKHPRVRCLVTSPLGPHPKIAEIILEKIPAARELRKPGSSAD